MSRRNNSYNYRGGSFESEGTSNPRTMSTRSAARTTSSARSVRTSSPYPQMGRAEGFDAGFSNISQSFDGPQTSYHNGQIVIKKRKRKKKMRGWQKALIGVVAVLLVALVGVGTAVGLYYNSIKNSMAYTGDVNELAGALVEADHQEPFYVLVIGSDNWETYGARSDAMILCRVDLENAQVTMVSVPRDTPYQIDGQTVKLNQVFAEQGEIACIEAVSELTGVSISHYVELEFDQLEQVVDSLGGVMVDVPYSIDYQVYTKDQPMVHLDAGAQLLSGNEAVALARMRTDYGTVSDFEETVRQANIRAMMLGVMKQILSSPASEIPGHIQTLAGMVKTDIPLSDLIDWATKIAQADNVTVYTCTGPYQGDYDSETGLWLTYEAPEQWARLMGAVVAGEDPSTVLGNDTLTNDGKVQNSETAVIETEAGDSDGASE